MTAFPTVARPGVHLRDLSFRYPDRTAALHHVSLSIGPGTSVCLAGPNGAGKSTLLLILAGLLRGEGSVEIDGVPPAVSRQLGLVFQDPDDQLFCATIEEDVAFGPRNQRLPEAEVARRVRQSLQATGLSGYEQRGAHHLSGGEKKRAAIAAVLACRPSVLALDEPWANLDARGARAVTSIVHEFAGIRIVTSQDLERAAEVCQRLVILDQGTVVAEGPMAELMDDAVLLESHGLEPGRPCPVCRTRRRYGQPCD
ncbi:MAG: energy-coupling factor ABC transporter ATP-binding protein [Pirellulaceae bacterium]